MSYGTVAAAWSILERVREASDIGRPVNPHPLLLAAFENPDPLVRGVVGLMQTMAVCAVTAYLASRVVARVAPKVAHEPHSGAADVTFGSMMFYAGMAMIPSIVQVLGGLGTTVARANYTLLATQVVGWTLFGMMVPLVIRPLSLRLGGYALFDRWLPERGIVAPHGWARGNPLAWLRFGLAKVWDWSVQGREKLQARAQISTLNEWAKQRAIDSSTAKAIRPIARGINHAIDRTEWGAIGKPDLVFTPVAVMLFVGLWLAYAYCLQPVLSEAEGTDSEQAAEMGFFRRFLQSPLEVLMMMYGPSRPAFALLDNTAFPIFVELVNPLFSIYDGQQSAIDEATYQLNQAPDADAVVTLVQQLPLSNANILGDAERSLSVKTWGSLIATAASFNHRAEIFPRLVAASQRLCASPERGRQRLGLVVGLLAMEVMPWKNPPENLHGWYHAPVAEALRRHAMNGMTRGSVAQAIEDGRYDRYDSWEDRQQLTARTAIRSAPRR